MTRQPHYWGFRTDTGRPREGYDEELKQRCVLRQGWGWDESHNLKSMADQEDIPKEHRANVRMYQGVKEGDFILVPRLPEWGQVTIAKAKEDWCKGYKFESSGLWEGYGHQFPAEYLTRFSRNNKHVGGDIRQTLKCRSRFWNMDRYSESIRKIIEKDENELIDDESREDRFRNSAKRVVQEAKLGDFLHEDLSEKFANSGWEYALVAGLKDLFPCYQVERTSGRKEKQHGTDILISMPGPLEHVQYGIAIQVKDWQGEPRKVEEAIEQIRKADDFWEKDNDLRIVEKIVVLTGSEPPRTGDSDVVVLGCGELKKLLGRMASSTAVAIDEDA